MPTAIVTGASRGIGRGIAAELSRTHRVIATYRGRRDAAESLQAETGCEIFQCDVSSRQDREALILFAREKFGRLDLLVNNAAVNIERTIEETDDAHWDLHLDVVLRASFFTVKAALPWLKKSKGSVVNIASELGLHAIPNNVAYVTAKHGLVTMTRALALELAKDGVRVNAICPGTMDTELTRDCANASPDPAAYYRAFEAYHPLGRLASPEEIADFALCVGSPAAGFMTGAALAIDGGSSAGRL
jgi:NAD(P)-dependent dehydrogenase (short-subunit alcohol dehydrogenase family)